jgi:hypothetical protein
MTFSVSQSTVISATKSNLKIILASKEAFWNGVEDDCVVAGGCFASMINDEAPKDYDVFVLNMNTQVYKHLTDVSRNNDQWVLRGTDAGQYLQNPHIFGTALNKRTKVQYILTDYTSRRELLDSFDYKHCTVSYVPKENNLYITPDAYDAIRRRELRVNGNNKPKFFREEKFVKRGWKPVNETPKIEGIVAQPYDNILMEAYLKMKEEKLKAIDVYSMAAPVPYSNQGFVAQTVDEILQTK